MTTTFSSRAYLKLILHAAKYPSRAVMGMLIAGPSSSAAASSSSSSSASAPLSIIDVLPLFHTAPLAPMIELALSQCELLLKNYPAGALLGGLYYAPELYEPKTNSVGEAVVPMPQCNVVCKMADKLTANAAAPKGGARIVLVDNVRLGSLGAPHSESTNSALESYESRSGKWINSGAVTVEGPEGSLESAVASLRSIIAAEQQRTLCDFDDHLDDAQADWTNVELEKKVLPTMAAAK